MNRESEIHQLALQTVDALRDLGLAEHTVWSYYSSCFLPIARFCEQHGSGVYDERILGQYAEMVQARYMVGESGTSATGKTYNYYKCANNKQKKGCHKKSVQKHWIEDIVVEQTVRILSDEALIQRIVDMVMEPQKKENTALPLLKKQLAETEKAIGNMLNAIQQGIITDSTKQRLNELEDSKKNLEVDIIREELEHPFLSAEQVRFWIDKFRLINVNDHKQRQRLIDSIVNAVYVYDDRLVLTFNYKDGAKEVTLADICSSDMGSGPAPCGVSL